MKNATGVLSADSVAGGGTVRSSVRSSLFVLSLVLALGVSAPSAFAIAAPTTYYVDPTGTDNASFGTTTSSGAFRTIQYAIDNAVSYGDTILIAAGNYPENVKITDKTSLTIQGAGVSTVIEPATGIGFEVSTSNDITIKNLKVDTTGAAAHGILVDGTGTGGFGTSGGGVSNNLHIENTTIVAGGTGIWGDSSADGVHSGWIITGNTITAQEGGIGFQDVTGATVSDNAVTTADGTNILVTSERYNLSTLLIDHNTVSGSGGSQVAVITDYNERAGGIMFETPSLPSTITGVTFSNNTFSNWGSRAIRVGQGDDTVTTGTVTGISIDNNIFQMTTDTAVIGGTDAPSATGSGNIFNVSGTAKIQTSVGAAFAGDIINVGAGGYNESLYITKPVTLQSIEGRDVTTIKSLTIATSSVTINGFTIEGVNAGGTQSANIYLKPGVNDITVSNNKINVGSGADDNGIGLLTEYNLVNIGDNLNVTGNIFQALEAGSNRAFFINPGINNFTFSGNDITGNFAYTATTQAKNGLVENNTITGAGAVGERSAGFRAWGYPDPTVWGHTTFSGNIVSGVTRGITVDEANNVTITGNTLSGNEIGVRVVANTPLSFDITTISVHNNNLSGEDTEGYGVTNNEIDTTTNVDASSNWWGSASGPYDYKSLPGTPDYSNPAGTGSPVTSYVDYKPWCTDGSTCATLSSANAITAFSFPQGTGVITGTAIAVTVPSGTSVTALVPTITVSAGASVSPSSGAAQDFTSPVAYTVTSADTSSTQAYTVTVTVAASNGGGGGNACGAGFVFNPTTISCVPRGATPAVPANVTTPVGCAPGDKFSTITGRNCNAATPAVPQGQVLGAAVFNFLVDLGVGSRHADVTELQKFLINAGYSIPWGATGYFGVQTRAAVIAFQKSHGVSQTGFVGPLTRGELNKGVTPTATNLTSVQADAIISIIESFGADASVVARVRASLGR